MYIFCSKALADALNIKKNELQKMPVDVMQLAMMLQEMKNEDVRKVAIEQVKILTRLNKDAQVKKIKKEFTFSLLNHIIKAQK